MKDAVNRGLLGPLVAVMVMLWAPSAEALLRLGGDLRWIPLGVETMEEGGESFRPGRQLESVGLGARALFGIEQFGIGVKINFAHQAFQDPDHSYSHLDLNAHLRMKVPDTRVAIFAEAGPVMALDIGGVGYNAAFGTEFDLLGWPLVDLNLGVAAQYASVPVGTGPSQVRMSQGVRAMVFVGVDFTLMPGFGGGSRE